MSQKRGYIAFDDIVVKNIEPILSYTRRTLLFDEFVADMEPCIIGRLDHGNLFDLWQLRPYVVIQGKGRRGPFPFCAGDIGGDTVDTAGRRSESIIACLILH